MEPVGAHRFAPVATKVGDATVSVGRSATGIGSLGVDGVVACDDHRPAVVISLTGEEEGVGVAVALCRVVAVVLVHRDGVETESAIGRRIDGQRVVESHHDRFTVSNLEQLRRQGSVEGPQRLRELRRHRRVELHRDSCAGSLEARPSGRVVIKTARTELADFIQAHAIAMGLLGVAQPTVGACSAHRCLIADLRWELIVALVRPAFTSRAPFARHRLTCSA